MTFAEAVSPVATVQQRPDGTSSLIVTQVGDLQAPSNRIIVKFRPSSNPERLLLPRHAGKSLKSDPSLWIVEVPPGTEHASILQYLSLPDVEYAEADSIVSAVDTIPNDPQYSLQWGFPKISAPAAWDLQTDSSDVIVAVLDTGIDYTHPDLQANLWTDPDTGAHGFSCFGDCIVGGLDNYGHGTHVAGTVGAATSNGIGVAGTNWNVRLLSLKFLGASGTGYISDAVLALDKLVELKHEGFNIRVVNNSWGGEDYSLALKHALQRVEEAGILIVAAAGNGQSNIDYYPSYPAAYNLRSIVSVLATNSSDQRASFSNYGSANVDIAAPGVDIRSTLPAGSCPLCDPTNYGILSGTSMATPHAAGVAAALFHRHPQLTPREVHDILLNSGSLDPLTEFLARMTTTSGRLNFYKALQNPLNNNPVLNGFPTLQIPAHQVVSPGQQVQLNAIVSDPDGDALSTSWQRIGPWGSLLYFVINSTALTSGPNPVTFTGPNYFRDTLFEYGVSTEDSRGGGATDSLYVTVLNGGPSTPPVPSMTVSPMEGPPGTVFNVHFSATDAENDPVWCSVGARGRYTGGTYAFLTLPSFNTYALTLSQEGYYRIVGECMDKHLVEAPKMSVIVKVGNPPPIEFPMAALSVDSMQGTAPLTVTWDASGSSSPNGGLLFFIFCKGTGWSYAVPPTGQCVYDKPGIYELLVDILDGANIYDQEDYHIVVLPESTQNCPELTLQAPDMFTNMVMVDMNHQLSAFGGNGSYTFQLTAGVLPNGVSMSSTGSITGVPTNFGSFSFTVRVVDSAGCAEERQLQMVVQCPQINILSDDVISGVELVPMEYDLAVSGGGAPYTFDIESGALPSGMTLTQDGSITGAPLETGEFVLTVRATDAAGCSGNREIHIIVVCGEIQVIAAELPDATAQVAYNQVLNASGGVAPITFAVTSGALPDGLSLSAAGVISGTPIVTGTFNFTVTATDSNGCTGAQAYSITVNCGTITLSPATLPDATTQAAYNQALSASGGTTPVSFAVTAGALPVGLSLSTAGMISGIPTATGTFNFAITATDNNGCTSTPAYSITVNCGTITISPATLPDVAVNSNYDQTLTPSGGTGAYSFAVTGGQLPPGLLLSPAGSLAGSPGSQGTFFFTITATDMNSCAGSQDYTILTTCLFCDDFEDGVIDSDWLYTKRFWTEDGHNLVADPGGKKVEAVANPVFSGCSSCYFETTLATPGGRRGKVWVLAWYMDKKNAVELVMMESRDKWILKERVDGRVARKVKASQPIDPGVFYRTRLTFDGTTLALTVNGLPMISFPAAAPHNGSVAFRSKGAPAYFGEIIVN